MIKYSNDKKVLFKEDTHEYFLGDKKLKSVTSYLSEFKNEFDSDYWSKKIAKRDNKTQDEILEEWNNKSKKACDIGTAIHKIFEDYTLNNYSIINGAYCFDLMEVDLEFVNELKIKSIVAINFIIDFFETKRLNPIYSEYIVYNNVLAGQIDMICEDKEGNIYILDFKTNSEIKTNSYGKTMKDIFSFLDDHSFNHYSLQLSIYKKLINHDVKKTYLVHITDGFYRFIETEDLIKNIKLF